MSYRRYRPKSKEHDVADTAVDLAVDRFIGELQQLSARWNAVAGSYIAERALLKLSDGLAKLPAMSENRSEAHLKLTNALLDFRDSVWSER